MVQKLETKKQKINAVRNLLIKANKSNRIYSVGFHKRSNGKYRKMICRGGVSKGVTGEGLKYNPSDHDLVTVFDMQKKEHRMIPCENVTAIHDRGRFYVMGWNRSGFTK
jgi:hypothetical protein